MKPDGDGAGPRAAHGADAYVAYTRRFFARWSPFYDAFARPIGFVYDAAVRRAGAAPGVSVLDLCTGSGEIARRCALRGARVAAVDLTPAMLTRARRKGERLAASGRGERIAFHLMDARRLAFADRSFDVAVLSFALHDMPRRVRFEVLAEAARVARRRLVVLDYAPPARGAARRAVVALLRSYETAYLDGFVRQGLPELLAEAGLPPARVSRPLPGFFALCEVALDGRAADGSREPPAR